MFDMNERDLKYFCQLIETGNYTATAKLFNVTQPAISASVKRLEHQYGTPLLAQQNHRSQILPTAAGRVLYIKARKIIKELAQVELEVKHANEPLVRLGFSHIAGGFWLPKVIEQFVKFNLLDFITTKFAHSAEILDFLRNGKLDAAVFSTLLPEESTDLRVTLLETHHMCVLANIHNPISRLGALGATDLKDIPIIARPKNTLPRTALDRFCHRQNVKPSILYEADSNQLVERLVERNVGVGFVIDDSVSVSSEVAKIPLKTSERINCYMQMAVRTSFLPNERQNQCIELLKNVKPVDN